MVTIKYYSNDEISFDFPEDVKKNKRNLTKEEIAVLNKNLNTSDYEDWRNVLVSDESDKFVFAVDNREFLYLVLKQDFRSTLEIGLLMSHDKIIFCHYLVNLASEVSLESEVTVGDDTDKCIYVINYRNAANVVFSHDVESIFDSRAALYSHRIINHAVLGSLDNSDLPCLLLY